MSKSSHKLTDEAFRAAHAAGMTVVQVAALNGTNAGTISRRAKRMGLKFRCKPGPKPQVERQAKARELRAEGLSYEKIGRAVSCSPSAAWWWCQ